VNTANLSDKLHDLLQVVLNSENFLGTILESGVRRIVLLVEERIKHSHVLGIRNLPVEGREVLSLSEFLVKTPKHLGNIKILTKKS